MRIPLKEIMKFPTCDKSRDELIAIFNSMKTSSKEDRFHYIKCWNGTQEEEPLILTAGLVAQPSDTPPSHDATDGKVALAACHELQESVKDGSDVSDSLGVAK